MLVFDGFEGIFRTVKLRPRMPECVVCGDNPSITELIDYEQFCGASPDDKVWREKHFVQHVLVVFFFWFPDMGSPHTECRAADHMHGEWVGGWVWCVCVVDHTPSGFYLEKIVGGRKW